MYTYIYYSEPQRAPKLSMYVVDARCYEIVLRNTKFGRRRFSQKTYTFLLRIYPGYMNMFGIIRAITIRYLKFCEQGDVTFVPLYILPHFFPNLSQEGGVLPKDKSRFTLLNTERR